MHVVMACGSMAFGPNTPTSKSLGGSEMAALQLCKALSFRGHEVHLFCNLADWKDGEKHADGVIYHSLDGYMKYVLDTEHDLTIGVRDPRFLIIDAKSRKKVLWAHDIFLRRGMGAALDQMGWTFDEIWCVSEWHRQQIHEATDYPLDHIVALRNGIVKYDDLAPFPRQEKTLLYASRPERGIDNLIKPGGIMERLPDYKLLVAFYNHSPEAMREYYAGVFARIEEMPNVEFIGSKSNHDLREIIAQVSAYAYPTQFEETSCILARECIEQGTPFLTTKEGALPETLREAGLFFEDWWGDDVPEKGSSEWCKGFAAFIRYVESRDHLKDDLRVEMSSRHDLYWDGVAKMVEDYGPDNVRKQTCGAAIIAYNNEDTILRTLNSLVGNVDEIKIAHGPSTDETGRVILRFREMHPEIETHVVAVPKIEAYKFGFDDARNESVRGLETDWILWIDTDEYLVGNIRKYLRANEYQSYLISQHHFTVEPRGEPAQIDRPARLFRNRIGFKARGHIHEHFELPAGGPGRAFLLTDVDIGHTGYQNETTRRDRFHRNFPFLEWEHSDPEQRNINSFLWFRDIVHRMRFAAMEGKRDAALALAQEGEAYYNENWKKMADFGPGIFQSLQYLAEIYNALGKGVPLKANIQFDDRATTIEGRFVNYDQFERVVRHVMDGEFKIRTGKYF
jgi:glycosyltransferase involved in cell wall biosynthesis